MAHLRDGRGFIDRELQSLLAHDQVEARVREWQRLGPAGVPVDGQVCSLSSRPSDVDHRRVQVQPSHAAARADDSGYPARDDARAARDIQYAYTAPRLQRGQQAAGQRFEHGRDEPLLVDLGGGARRRGFGGHAGQSKRARLSRESPRAGTSRPRTRYFLTHVGIP